MEHGYVCIVDTTPIIGVMMTKGADGILSIAGFKTEAEGLDFFESAYNRNHQRSYEASMSACINSIAYQPSIIRLSLNTIKSILKKPQNCVKLNHISGSMTVLELDRIKGKKLWEMGQRPRLMPVEL